MTYYACVQLLISYQNMSCFYLYMLYLANHMSNLNGFLLLVL